MDIYFDHDSGHYRVSDRAYDKGRIVLPNGSLYNVIWDESGSQPRVRDLDEVRHNFKGCPASVIARLERAELAEKL